MTDEQPEPSGSPTSKWDLAVVGAGAAGLACARVARAAGLRVLLLEARDRCGGRAWSSDPFGLGVEFDHGAGWVHASCPGNPMLELANVRNVELGEDPVGANFVFDLQTRAVLDCKALCKYHEAVEENFESVTERDVSCERSEDDEPLVDALVNAGLPLRGNGTSHHNKKGRKQLSAHLLRWALSAHVERDNGTDAEELSAVHVDDGFELPGGNLIATGGYGSFVRGLVKGPISKHLEEVRSGSLDLRLNEAVTRVKWTADAGVTHAEVVRLTTTAGCTYVAQRVVVALPLGVLKANEVVFVPPLPTTKLGAIERLGCASMTKVFLRYPRRFWHDQISGWGLCGTSPERVEEHLFERALFFPLPHLKVNTTSGDVILCALLYGRAARALELKTDDEVGAAVTVALRQAASCQGAKKVFPGAGRHGEAVLAATGVHVSRWHTDSRARGCWTAFVVGSSPADSAELARPVGDGRLLSFAGEHTTADEMGTVHGAWLTGLREAEGILLECIQEGRFESGKALSGAISWMLYCENALARARALQENNDESSSSSDES
eukprot:TRINITY_DN41891_c0_g1_i1.p1 TRINITY_DN41891_c0_g1~~TRINITY_DN41891_c0_g1_i1.p1  ORF type:complete len:585 (-),score=80.10 TRINITY_DN41891_c0_g1_i1:176-1834(-)